MKRPPEIAAAIKAAGSLSKLAKRIGVSRQAVDQWRRIPAERARAVADATGIPMERLRPDLFRRAA